MANPNEKSQVQFKQGDICHFEIPIQDKERAKAFYGEVFGWKFNDVAEMDYTLFETPGKNVGGGLFKPDDKMPNKVVNYLTVNSIEATAKKVEQLGGKTLTPKLEVPGHGFFMHILDSEGNLLSLWQGK